MGFDRNNPDEPLVNVHKRTTQVNVWMAVGVGVFLLVAILLMVRARREHGPDPASSEPETRQAAPARP